MKDRSQLIVLASLILLFVAIFTLDMTIFPMSGFRHYLPFVAAGLILFLCMRSCGGRCCSSRAKE